MKVKRRAVTCKTSKREHDKVLRVRCINDINIRDRENREYRHAWDIPPAL